MSEADLDGASPEGLAERYAEAGFAVAPRPAGAAEAAALGTTWAKRLTRSDPGRRFVRLAGTAVPAPEPATPGSAPRTGS